MIYISTASINNPAVGSIRLNVNQMEIYDGNKWTPLSTQATNDDNKIFIEIGYQLFNQCGYWVSAIVTGSFEWRMEQNDAINAWVKETYGDVPPWGIGRYTASDNRYYFREERDRDWFILRWS